jgi:sulfotransferase
MKKFIMLSGLPRSGSTLFSSIMAQHPDVYSEGNSAVCQLMWDTKISCDIACRETLVSNFKNEVQFDLIKNIPLTYYKTVSKSIILDKCRSWTLQSNFDLIKTYITENPKIVVLYRPIDEILISIKNLFIKNEKIFDENMMTQLLSPNSEPIIRSLYGIQNAIKNNQNQNFLFVSYDELIHNTTEVFEKICNFYEIKKFNFNFENITRPFNIDDDFLGLKTQHEVRSKLEKKEYKIELPKEIKDACMILNKTFEGI